MIYFDHNATTPLSVVAREAWLRASEEFIGNPSSPHRLGSRADRALTEAREDLASTLGCDALDIVWTSGATEANNAVLHHFASVLPPDAEAWVSAIEHPCVTEAARRHFPKRHRLIPVTRDGLMDLDWLARKLKRSRPELLAVMAVNNETGVVQPVREGLALCRAPGEAAGVQGLGGRLHHGPRLRRKPALPPAGPLRRCWRRPGRRCLPAPAPGAPALAGRLPCR